MPHPEDTRPRLTRHLTSADGPVVTPCCQRLGHSLARDGLGSLDHIIVLTGELHIGTNPGQ